MLLVPARVRAAWISMSGFTPGVRRRNTFIRASSPYASEELLCSPLNRVEWVERSRSWVPVRWNVRPGWVAASSPSAAAWNASSHTWVASRSCSAS